MCRRSDLLPREIADDVCARCAVKYGHPGASREKAAEIERRRIEEECLQSADFTYDDGESHLAEIRERAEKWRARIATAA